MITQLRVRTRALGKVLRTDHPHLSQLSRWGGPSPRILPDSLTDSVITTRSSATIMSGTWRMLASHRCQVPGAHDLEKPMSNGYPLSNKPTLGQPGPESHTLVLLSFFDSCWI